jgi:hypothetical protein
MNKENIFKCIKCSKTLSTKGNLKTHLWQVHSIGEGKIFKCTEKNCDYECKSNGNLKRHLWQVHSIGEGKIIKCNEKDCDYECKSDSSLKRHLWQVHSIGEGKIFKCTEKNCDYECKSKGNLKIHLWQVHSIGEGKIFKCNERDCDYECKSNGNLKTHLWQVHSIGEGKIFKCTEKNCDYECKLNGSLKTHLSGVHDIGDYECQICFKMVFKLLPDFDNPNVNNRKEIIKNACRNCFKEITGYTSRAEKQMIEYIQQDKYISPYIYSKDKILKGASCNTKRRPDLVISSTEELVIVIECDEKQHQSYNASCEMGRMDEILDELKGCRTIFIRWNPDYCKYNGIRLSKTRDNRLIELKELILNLIKNNWTDDYTMVYYMYYNEDNEAITNRHKFKLLY